MKLSMAFAACVALAAFGLTASHAEAEPGSMTVDSVNVAVGQQGSADVRVSGITPGVVIDWVVNVAYDQGLASIANLDLPECTRTETPCTGTNNSNPGEDARIVLEGTSPGGMPADATLATIVFRCEHVESSPLTISVETWSGEVGVDQPPPATVSGTLECIEAPTATPAPSLPPSGAGPAGGGNALQWAFAILSATGASLIAIAALRRERA